MNAHKPVEATIWFTKNNPHVAHLQKMQHALFLREDNQVSECKVAFQNKATFSNQVSNK